MVGASLDLKKTTDVLSLNRTDLRSGSRVGLGSCWAVGLMVDFDSCLSGCFHLSLEVSWGFGCPEEVDVLGPCPCRGWGYEARCMAGGHPALLDHHPDFFIAVASLLMLALRGGFYFLLASFL